jgi:outer membrane immunogenic protein
MRQTIIAVLAAATLSLACAPAALAADMAAPKPMYTKAPVMMAPSWAGFYVGGDVGARWSTLRWTTDNFSPAAPNPAVANGVKLNNTSFVGGGYAGYNWMVAPVWLVGLEGDLSWGGGTATSSPFPGDLAGAGATGHDFVNAKLGWDGSVRGRIGYLAAPNWLVYGTGGVAWQQITTSASCDASGPSYCGVALSESSAVTKAGWTVGGGVETMLWGNWIGRAQYRYADFGSVSNTLPPAPGSGFNATVRVRTNTAVLGIAYKFN